MNYLNAGLLEELAAQYALGTLRGRARARFERICREQPAALKAVHRWEDHLVELTAGIRAVAPPLTVFETVLTRIGRAQASPPHATRGWWSRARLALAAGVAAAVVATAIWFAVPPQATQIIATFAEQQTPLWRIAAPSGRQKLVVTRVDSASLQTDRDYELWALPDSGAAPISLGLMPKTGTRNLVLSRAQQSALTQASKIAISLEPIGGSRTGAPTGPVLFVTDLTNRSAG